MKNELNKFSKEKINNKNIFKYKKLNKKIISIFLGANSHINILEHLKFVDLSNFYLIIRPHPFIKDINKNN